MGKQLPKQPYFVKATNRMKVRRELTLAQMVTAFQTATDDDLTRACRWAVKYVGLRDHLIKCFTADGTPIEIPAVPKKIRPKFGICREGDVAFEAELEKTRVFRLDALESVRKLVVTGSRKPADSPEIEELITASRNKLEKWVDRNRLFKSQWSREGTWTGRKKKVPKPVVEVAKSE